MLYEHFTVRCVNNNGTLNNNNCNNNNGVRPFREKVRKSKLYAEIRTSLSKERITFLLFSKLRYLMTDFEKITDFNNLYKAYKKAKSGKGYRNSSAKFEVRALDGIHKLKQQLESRQYKVSEYNQFYVYEPKKRLIEAAAFKDKIVQHSICDNVLIPTLKDEFIRNNFAGQKGKGTLFGLNSLKADMQSFYYKNGMNGYILKADVTKYYYTIDHDILKKVVREYFNDEGVIWLCDLIIDSTDNPGVPLGNQTSQVFALLYLNSMDHFITEELGIKYYGRYTDDFYLIHKDKEYLKHCLNEINIIIKDRKLSLNGKTQIMPFKQGVKFLGFHTYIKNGELICKIRNENKRNAYRKYMKMARLVAEGKLDKKKFDECLTSWKAHAAFGDCEQIIQNLDVQIEKILKSKKEV